MSGSKCGEVSIVPAAVGAAVVAVPVIIVGGIAMGVGAAVNAYLEAREKVRKKREEAMSEQRKGLETALEAWRHKLETSAKDISSPPVRTSGEIISDMISSVPVSSSVKAEDFLNEMFGGTTTSHPSSIPPGKADLLKCREVIDNIQGLLKDISMPLPENVSAKVASLHKEQDISKVAAIARDIRIGVNHEVERIRQEQQEAKKLLDDLPPDFPTDARKILSEVAYGHERFDEKLREIIQETLKQTKANRQRAAADILSDTLSEMGYEVSPVSNSIFAEGGNVYFRNSDWDDGYCIKLSVNDCRIHFNMMKTAEGSMDKDAPMEGKWKSEFEEVRERLDKKGIRITNIKVNSEPGDTVVPINKKIPIETKKKKRKPTVVYQRRTTNE